MVCVRSAPAITLSVSEPHALQAAARAFDAPSAGLSPELPQYLSTLMAELATSLGGMVMTEDVLVAPGTSRFVKSTAPRKLYAHAASSPLARGLQLSSWTSMQRLNWFGHVLPASLPPALEHLWVACRSQYDWEQPISQAEDDYHSLLTNICSLQRLQTLHLSFWHLQLALPQCFRLPSSLREIWLSMSASSANLEGLRGFAGSVRLELSIDGDERWPWQALQGLPSFDPLIMRTLCGHSAHEQALLAGVRAELCELTWNFQGVLPVPQCRTLRIAPDDRRVRSATLQWAQLEAALRQGVVSISGLKDSLKVVGCSGVLPKLPAGSETALMVDLPAERVEGLPMHNFRPGPHRGLVWQTGPIDEQRLLHISLRPMWIDGFDHDGDDSD